MTHERTAGVGPGIPHGGAAAVDEIDPELVALAAPPRGRRIVAMTLMAGVVVASAALLLSLRADIAYFFASPEAADVGEALRVDPAALTPNTFVRVRGTPMAAATVRYGRVLSSTTYAVFPLAGQRTIFVQLAADDAAQSRALARGEFSGRLVTFGQLGGRFSAVKEYLREKMGEPVSSESFLLLADESPGSYGWSLGLGALALLFIVVNVALLLRWFRPLPSALPGAAGPRLPSAPRSG